MTRAGLLVLLALSSAAGCHRSAPDAVPPAPSGGLVPAPPGALGAHAASVRGTGGASPVPLAEPPADAPPPGAGGTSGAPPAPLLPAPAGSGVAL